MQLLDALIEPGKLFTELKEKPTALLPLALLIVSTMVVWFLYYQRVDMPWLVDQLLAASKVPAEQAEKTKDMMAGSMKWGALIGSPIIFLIIFAISALYYKLAGKVAGAEFSFRAWFGFSVWASVPMLLSIVATLVSILTMSPQTTQQAVSITHLNPLLVNLPMDNPWFGLTNAIDLISIWTIWAAANGWRVWAKSGWGSAVFVAALPSVVIYGLWALYIVLMH